MFLRQEPFLLDAQELVVLLLLGLPPLQDAPPDADEHDHYRQHHRADDAPRGAERPRGVLLVAC